MLLSDHEIKSRGLVHDYIEKNFRATSYDLTIGTILGVDGVEKEQLKLEPSGVAEVISGERITLPTDVTGLAMVKTDLCNRGILALNIGIVGPGYDGYLSTTLLNFSKTDFLLTKNEVFLRLIFQECYESPRKEWPKPISHDDYVAVKRQSVINFSDKFLNLDMVVTKISQPFWDNLKRQALTTVPVLALGLAALTFVLTIGVNYSNRYIWSYDDVKRQNIKQEILDQLSTTREPGLESKIKNLEQQIKRLEAKLTQDQSPQSGSKTLPVNQP